MKDKVCLTFLGTSHHRSSHHNLMTEFHDLIESYSQTEDGQNIATRLFDGVGCVGTAEHPTPGTYIYHPTRTKEKEKVADEPIQEDLAGIDIDNPDYSEEVEAQTQDVTLDEEFQPYKEVVKFWNALTLRNLRGVITGEGVESLTKEAIIYLQQIYVENNGKWPAEVNLQGFSRGADTCVRVANLLKDLCPDTKVNLFLVDPVPGPGRYNSHQSYVIPENVANCHLVLMSNEHHPVFTPQDLDSYVFANRNTRLFTNCLVGNHGAGVALKPHSNLGCDASYLLVQDAMLKFNISSGFLADSTTVKKEYALVEGRYVEKDLCYLPKYNLFDGSEIAGVIPFEQIMEVFQGEVKDCIYLQDGKLYYVDSVFKKTRVIDPKSLDKPQLRLYQMMLEEITNLSKDAKQDSFMYLQLVTDGSRRLIKSILNQREHRVLSDSKRFELFCKSVFEFRTNISRPVVKNYTHRKVLTNRSLHIRDQELFLDEEHRTLFMRLYPDLYAWLFVEQTEGSDYHKRAALNELFNLRAEHPNFSQLLAGYFGIDVDAAITNNQLSKCSSGYYSRSVYGESIGGDEYLYLTNSLRNILNACRHRTLDNEYDKKLISVLASTLNTSSTLVEEDALAFLKQFIGGMQSQKFSGFIHSEVMKIIYDPQQQLDKIRQVLEDAVSSVELLDAQRSIIMKYGQQLIDLDFESFSWERFVQIRGNIIRMHADLFNFAKLNDLTDDLLDLSNDLSQKLANIYTVDHGIPTTVDKIIVKLRSYQRWSYIFSFFPKGWGLFDENKIKMVAKLINNLTDLKAQKLGDDLIAINDLLTSSMQKAAKKGSESTSQSVQKSSYMDNYLNRIISESISLTKPQYTSPEDDIELGATSQLRH